MAFSTIADRTLSVELNEVTNGFFDIQMPAVVNAGELLLCFITYGYGRYNAAVPAGWTLEFNVNKATDGRLICISKEALGTEGGTTVTVDAEHGGGAKSKAVVYRVQGWNSVEKATSTSSSTPNPPSLTPAWGSAETLWIAAGVCANGAATVSAHPSNYNNGGSLSAGGSGSGATLAWADRELDAISENPEAFTLAATQSSVAATIAIEPGSKGAATPPTATTADLSVTLEDAVLAATGSQASGPVTVADLNVTLDGATLSADAGWAAYAMAYITTDDATVVSAGVVGYQPITADLSVALDPATVVSSGVGALSTVGVLDVTMDEATITSIASLLAFAARVGDLSVTMDEATVTSVGVTGTVIPVAGDLNVTLDDAGISASAFLGTLSPTVGNLNVSLANAAMIATASAENIGKNADVNITMDDAVVVAAAVMVIYPFDGDVSSMRTAIVTALGITNNLQTKDPEATLDYGVDWSEWLADVNDVIDSSEWIHSDDITIRKAVSSGGVNSVWITGGINDKAYKLTNRIRTDGGRASDCTIYIRCKQQ